MNDIDNKLPPILCGPMLRRLTCDKIVLWWVSPEKLSGRLDCYYPGRTDPFLSIRLSSSNLTTFQFGSHAHIHLADIGPGSGLARTDNDSCALPLDRKIEYNLVVDYNGGEEKLPDLIGHITYPGERLPSFMVRKSVRRFFHGSCRKPHHDSEDAFTGLDKEIQKTLNDIEYRPALLMLTGDQIYADDVAGPMLQAIHVVISLLGLYEESFDQQAPIKNGADLYARPDCYYLRENIIPRTKVGEKWYLRGGAKHIFSSSFAHNHMITFAEWMAMYLLVWSPCLWDFIDFSPLKIPEQYKAIFEKELACLQKFKADLPKVQRLLAHIPVYMIFDDHDVTDDWNLTAKWEQQAYGNSFTKRIIGNGLMAYFLCQGWGNAPHVFDDALMDAAQKYSKHKDKACHDAFIDALLAFRHWHYEVALSPELVVIDSRTRRWKRDRLPSSPSGLLDWEALMKLQHKLMRTDSVLLVAPGPIFGVKLIELIQRLFTMFGYSLAVDAENWMGHRKSAYVLLEIFKNAKTASRYVVISGDVHYSFAYDIELRFAKNRPGIWQITSSGIKNEFPGPILRWLDRFNQVMYAPWSPLNIFTKRRDMTIHERIPKGKEKQKLISDAGIGRVTLDSSGAPVEIAEIYADKPPLFFETK